MKKKYTTPWLSENECLLSANLPIATDEASAVPGTGWGDDLNPDYVEKW